MTLNESTLEAATLDWLAAQGYAIAHGPDLAPGEPAAERASFADVQLDGRLQAAVARLNPAIPAEAREDALRKIRRVDTPSLIQTNRAVHRMLRDGVAVAYRRADGSIAGDHVRLIDFDDVENNDFLAVNHFTVVEAGHDRRSDVVAQAGVGEDDDGAEFSAHLGARPHCVGSRA